MKNHIQNAIVGALAGLAISAALFGPMLISVERAAPNGLNIYFGGYGFHIAAPFTQ